MKKRVTLLATFLVISTLTGCNNENIHEHTFSTDWSFDETSHWHESTCGHDVVSNLSHHDYDEYGICKDCGYEKVEEHEHTYSDKWSYDEHYHWHASTCGHDVVKDFKEHTFGDDNICDYCGYEKEVSNVYIVSFDSNGGSSVDPIFVNEGDPFVRPDNPTKENLVFIDWYETSDFSGNPYVFGTRVTKDTRLYALWGAEVTFTNYDGRDILTKLVRENNKVEEPDDPTYLNAHFEGWYLNQEHKGDKFDFDTPVTRSMRLYAIYCYNVTFLASDQSQYKVDKVMLGDKAVQPENPLLDYHDFDSWYLDEQFTNEFDFNSEISSDITLYSNFIPNTYDIVYVGCESLHHTNPTSYVYGEGVEEFVKPTSDDEDYEFYGWYLDEDFQTELTSISSSEHETVYVYAKRAEKHAISWINWPEAIENTNPLTFTQYDDYIVPDLSKISESPGYKNVTFKIDGEVAPAINTALTRDVEVEIIYTQTETTVTFNPNKGEFLPLNSYIFVDFGIDNMDPVKVSIPSEMIENGINLFDPEVLTIPQNEGHLFTGFSSSLLSNIPLSLEEINNIPCGSTIYACWEQLNTGSIPYRYEKLSGETFNTTIKVPVNVSKINFNFSSTPIEQGFIQIIGYGATQNTLHNTYIDNRISGAEPVEIKDTVIDVEGYKTLEIIYNYDKQAENPSYSIEITPKEYNSLIVKPSSSDKSLTQTYAYGEEFIINEPVREHHTFVGWFDIDGNKYESGTLWTIVDEKITLIAKFKYNNTSEFLSELESQYLDYKNQLAALEYLDEPTIDNYQAQLKNAYNTSIKVFENDLDFEEVNDAGSNVYDSIARIFYRASEENVNCCKAEKCEELEAAGKSYISLFRHEQDEPGLAYERAIDAEVNSGILKIMSKNSIAQINIEFNKSKGNLMDIYEAALRGDFNKEPEA